MTSQTLETIGYKDKILQEIPTEDRVGKRLLGRVYGYSTAHCVTLAAEHCANFSQAQFFCRYQSNTEGQFNETSQTLKEWKRLYPDEPVPRLNKPASSTIRIDLYAEAIK